MQTPIRSMDKGQDIATNLAPTFQTLSASPNIGCDITKLMKEDIEFDERSTPQIPRITCMQTPITKIGK